MFVSLTTRLKRQRESELWPVRKKFEALQVLVKNQWQIQDWGGDTTNLLSGKIFAENCMKIKKKNLDWEICLWWWILPFPTDKFFSYYFGRHNDTLFKFCSCLQAISCSYDTHNHGHICILDKEKNVRKLCKTIKKSITKSWFWFCKMKK